MKLAVPINGECEVPEFNSQAGQDLFVLMALNGKRNGRFIDLGCNHPVEINNTYILEKNYDWTGLSFDIDQKFVNLYPNFRKTKALVRDCTKLTNEDFNLMKGPIDYMSIDLEPARVTLACLKSLPFGSDFLPSLITFEHEFFRHKDGPEWRCPGVETPIRDISRSIIESHGYRLACSDVANDHCIYEDWYYHPSLVDFERIKPLVSNGKNWPEIIFV